jgi:thiamine-monophosphate kinase
MTDEFERIARLRTRFEGAENTHVLVGIGDDAAVLASGTGNLVLSVDTAAEGVHFERHFAPWSVIGARAFSAALSDLAAMGATPRAALSSLIVPPAFPTAAFNELNVGLAEAARDYACPIIGGNLCAGQQLSLTTTVIGAVEGTGTLRSGARAGDLIYVTGALGSAALGLTLLQRSAAERGPAFVTRWQRPRARIDAGRQLLGIASAMIDISDGALQDLGHICEESGLAAELEAERLPLDPGMRELAVELGLDPFALALLGGEDYELLFTLPAASAPPPLGTCIGRMTDQPGPPRVLAADGRVLTLDGHGYRHFGG